MLNELAQNMPVISTPTPASSERLRGGIDVPLNAEGKSEAQDMALRLRGQIDYICTSPLQRATEVARAIKSTNPRAKLIVIPALKSWCFGALDGELANKAIPIINDYIRNKPYAVLPGRNPLSTQSGESYNQFVYRLVNFMQQEIDEYRQGTYLYITHIIDITILKGWMDDGIINNLNVNSKLATAKDPTDTGDLLKYNPSTVSLDYVEDASSPGIYIMRHGKTEFNS